jgi:hypothetical protein
MTTDFGNTFVHLRRVSIVGAIFAFVTGILFILVAYAHDRLSTHWVSILVFPLCIGGILPFVPSVSTSAILRIFSAVASSSASSLFLNWRASRLAEPLPSFFASPAAPQFVSSELT